MAEQNVLGTLFSDIATAIRTKTGDTATLKPLDFPAAIAAITTLTLPDGDPVTPGDFDYDLTVGETFSLDYSGSSPSVTCPPCLSWYDDGGTLVFTAASAGNGTLTLHQSDTTLGSFTVRVIATARASILTGTFKATTGSPYTVTHNIGTVPDFLLVYARTTPAADTVDMAYGFSARLKAALGEGAKGLVRGTVTVGSSLGASTSSVEEDMEQPTTAMDAKGAIRAVTATTFTVGGTDLGLFTNKTYAWFALCGLCN